MTALSSLLSILVPDEMLDDFSEMARIVIPMLSFFFGFFSFIISSEWIAFIVSHPKVAVSDPTLSSTFVAICSEFGACGRL